MNKQQQAIDRWFQEKNWPYWSPHEILARLMEETGEFARLINHQYGPKKKKEGEAPQDLEDEIGAFSTPWHALPIPTISTSTRRCSAASTRSKTVTKIASSVYSEPR
jgi:hypothetical protein